jgi:hypothetical protein
VDASKEVDRIHREAIGPRKINFATPTDHQPLTTPKHNMKKATELLAKNDEEIDIAHLRTLIASAMKQHSKADSSRRLETNPEICVSTAQKDASGRKRRDEESRTGSTEREEEPENIQIQTPYPRKHLRRTQTRGKVQCTLAVTSNGIRHLCLRPCILLRHLADAVQSETADPMGLVELISATT